MLKTDLHFFESPVNRFSVAYLVFLLENSGYAEKFNVSFFSRAGDIVPPEGGNASSVFVFSFMTSILPEVMECVAEIKSSVGRPDGRLIIAGGPHATGDPDSALKAGFDLVFSGEGERMWPEFLETVENNSGRLDFRGSILSKYGGAIVSDPCPDPVPLDPYLPFGSLYGLVPPLEIMRGCFYNCKFCQTSTFGVRFRGAASVEEFFAEYLRRSYTRLCFICPSAFHYQAGNPRELNLDAIENMLELAKSRYKIKYIEYGIFPSEARPETINPLTVGIIKKYCSNRRVSIGAQSGDDGRMRAIGRGHFLNTVYGACDELRAGGITPVVDFIFGFPDETEEEQLRTLGVIKDLHTRFGARIQTHFFMPLPGTALYGMRCSGIGPKALATLEKYSRGGISTNWYEEGIDQSRRICSLLDELKNKKEIK